MSLRFFQLPPYADTGSYPAERPCFLPDLSLLGRERAAGGEEGREGSQRARGCETVHKRLHHARRRGLGKAERRRPVSPELGDGLDEDLARLLLLQHRLAERKDVVRDGGVVLVHGEPRRHVRRRLVHVEFSEELAHGLAPHRHDLAPVEGDVEALALALDLAQPLASLQHHPQNREPPLHVGLAPGLGLGGVELEAEQPGARHQQPVAVHHVRHLLGVVVAED
mmetsp:Transcript_56909/g.135155  ORF Transcript_56909/g.135155 Transcript_56909/m.135155 type:complete len:224 (-) Transcript_56909:1553-2224(-)